jgi:peroxiredoxin
MLDLGAEVAMLAVGSDAPDFELGTHSRTRVRLSDYRGKKHVVLAFHPLAFTPVCSAEIQAFERSLDRFTALDAVVFGISLDADPSKRAWAETLGGIRFDLLSDFLPQGAVSSAYGVLRPDGLPERAIVVVDKHGKIAWARKYEMGEQPDLDQLLRAIPEP